MKSKPFSSGGQLTLPGLTAEPSKPRLRLGEGAMILPSFATANAIELLSELQRVVSQAAFRHMTTPGGRQMSVAMSNCGSVGWYTDRQGYRYSLVDPVSNHSWPAIPSIFQQLAKRAAEHAGYVDFQPDSCLINRYEPQTQLTLHQDKNERDLSQPIVSVSLGVPAVFLFGGNERQIRPSRTRLEHGDVVVWGGASRLAFHGIAPLTHSHHSLTGACRYNLTFRCAS